MSAGRHPKSSLPPAQHALELCRGVGSNALAVLHPSMVSVYEVQASGGSEEAITSFKLKRLYSHKLGFEGKHFSAHSMATGGFGGARGADFMAVLSMDGQVEVLEQDRPAFLRQLPDILLPGAILYVPSTDSLVTTTSTHCVVSYKYSTLAAAESSHPSALASSAAAEAARGGGRDARPSGLPPTWSVSIGAPVHDLAIGRISRNLAASQCDIIAITPHTVFAVREAGPGASPQTLSLGLGDETGAGHVAPFRLQRRLDFYPACLAVLPRGGGGLAADNLALASATDPSQVRVYKEGTVAWAAKLQGEPIALTTGTFGGVRGLLVSMDARGSVSLQFLGSDPPGAGLAKLAGAGKDLDYEAMDEEHRSLLATIRESQSEVRAPPKDRVVLRARVNPTVTLRGAMGAADPPTATAAVELLLFHTIPEDAQDVHVALSLPPCLTSPHSSLHLPRVPGSTSSKAGTEPLGVQLEVQYTGRGMPASLQVTAVATHVTAGGEPRSAQTTFQLPMALVAVPVLPVKEGAFRIILQLSSPPPFMPSLWEDVLAQPHVEEDVPQALAAARGVVVSLRYLNGADVTAVASKSGNRLQVYSGSLEALGLFLQELVARLRKAGSQPPGVATASSAARDAQGFETITYEAPLPLADVFSAIDTHFAARLDLRRTSSQLNDRAAQFRVIQKRLLARFKDRNPAPLNHMDTLLAETHRGIVALADAYAAGQEKVVQAGNVLTCVLHLLHLLICLKLDLPEEEAATLAAHMALRVHDGGDPGSLHAQAQGWEERADAGVSHLLRTALAKNSKEASAVIAGLDMPPSTDKLKRHLAILCDRLKKGALAAP